MVEHSGTFYQHYMPDASQAPKPGKAGKFAEVYAAGLDSLCSWARSREPVLVYGVTNLTNSAYRSKLLGGGYSVMNTYDDGYGPQDVYVMNLTAIDQDTGVHSRISKLAARAKSQDYVMESW